jgi:putative membrane-bound dehydrogenase-like protein
MRCLPLLAVVLSVSTAAAESNAPPDKAAPPAPDVYKYAGLPPDKAAAAMTVPEGFTVSLFAGEPDVQQPIAMAIDDRGRLWVAEAFSYPVRRPEGEGQDRIVIFEDTKGAGTFDKRTVFMEGLNLVSGLEVGHGGVWIGAAPYLMFVPVNDGEDKPAGKPEILLDGWHYEDTHEVLNSFCWGPDGWLYGCHGVFTHSMVGKPGTPDKDRTPINAGVWRYHPTKHIFEVFAHGTSNPWGLDFDEHGQAFVTACVIPHAFHIAQGGRYQRQAGDHFNPYTYADIQTIADHLHWQGKDQWAGNFSSGSLGGGHAHCGLMLYQGGAWPKEYNGRMFMGNIHGHRINNDILRPKGSSFVASHGPDFLLANDAWARFINMKYGPDGNVYLLDWYDKQACHNGNVDLWDRSNGRIYKISYRGTKPVTGLDLSKKSDKELVDLLLDKNEWYVRHAERILMERAENKKLDKDTHEALAKIAFEHKDETRRLRGLWTLQVTGGLTEERILKGLEDKGDYVRAWAIQLALEDRKPSQAVLQIVQTLAACDSSPVVQLYVASAAQRMPADVPIRAYPHQFDRDFPNDPNLPLMYWYALEAHVSFWEKKDLDKVRDLFAEAGTPVLEGFMVRRIAAVDNPAALDIVVDELKDAGLSEPAAEAAAKQKLILRNMLLGLKGRGGAAKPKKWDALLERDGLLTSKDAELKSLAYSLAVHFGDAKAIQHMRDELASADAAVSSRQAALDALLEARDKELAPVLQQLIGDKAMRGAALRALAAYDDPKTPDVVLAAFAALPAEEKRDALNTLAARPAYGKALLDAVAAKKLAVSDVPAEIVRDLRNLNDKDLDQRIAEVWGVFRKTPADRIRIITEWRNKINATTPAPPDLALGRAMFAKTCQQCHTLYGVGGKVGPDITGSNRADLNYLLENILDPSAVIPNDYKATLITLKAGRVVTGIVRGETPDALTVVTANETLTIPVKEIDSRKISDVSMMPEDVLKPLDETQVRALVAYLRNPTQTPILATADNAKDLFNGKDLSGWDGDPKVWSVQDGEIVGKGGRGGENADLTSQMVADDFRLTLKMKMTASDDSSGIAFRAQPTADGRMKGLVFQAGRGLWGGLAESNGRGVLSRAPDQKTAKLDDWNDIEIVAEGGHVRTFLNGRACADLEDAASPVRGGFGLLRPDHAGTELRVKDLKLEVLAPPKHDAGP